MPFTHGLPVFLCPVPRLRNPHCSHNATKLLVVESHGDINHTLKSPPMSTSLVPPALLAAPYMATASHNDSLHAQESPPLPEPWTTMTIERPTGGHQIEGHGFARHDVHHVANFLHSEHVRSKAIKTPADIADASVVLRSTPRNASYPWWDHGFSMCAMPWGSWRPVSGNRPRMAPWALKTPIATALLSSMPGAVGTPSPRMEPWRFQDTAVMTS